MAEIEKINNVRKVSRSVESFQKILEKNAPNREHFEALMQRTETVKTDVPAKEPEKSFSDKAPTLFDEVGRLNSKVEGLSKYSHDQLIAQAREATKQISSIQDQLAQTDVRLRDSVQNLLKNKLGNIQDNLKVALDKAGIDALPLEGSRGGGGNPMVKFLDMLANGQHNLERLSGGIERMAAEGRDVSPASLLAVQLKVHHVQQELEFFTSLLNKALESTKTLMNVQV